jgi:hypothetical protein
VACTSRAVDLGSVWAVCTGSFVQIETTSTSGDSPFMNTFYSIVGSNCNKYVGVLRTWKQSWDCGGEASESRDNCDPDKHVD